MSVFKCKMCGGDLNVLEGQTVCECEYCGSKQTLPRLDSDRKANLYDRANHFRRNNEFDKAMGTYETILNEDPTDAEAYWSIVLCRYGIEYVEDPATRRRVPTVNRAQFTSIFDDEDYKSALKNADVLQRSLYEDEAKAINEIQKGILEISAKEEPFDVFICYKETDANGRRTPDSVLATDLYHQLTNEGFKVFFSRITLEDKLGQEYEPYIFAALNSAKAMVVLGTKPEHFNAVWVKNEWSRYLALIKAGAKKTLIPAYRDMDPYDLPEEFSHLQAQDMSKLGFMQDLIRGIKKIIKTDEPKQATIRDTVVQQATQTNTAPLLRRAFMFLEDSNWQSADEYCEKVLDLEPENAEAYLGKLMAELKVCMREQLKDQSQPFVDRNNYQKALRFADDKLKAELSDIISYINDRNETDRKEGIYQKALLWMKNQKYTDAQGLFDSIPDYKDAATRSVTCAEKAEAARKDGVYAEALALMKKETDDDLERAICLFVTIRGWRDTDEQATACRTRISELKAQREADRLACERKTVEAQIAKAKRKKKNRIIVLALVLLAALSVILWIKVILPNQRYNDAVSLYEAGQYAQAITVFESLNGYRDSAKQIEACWIEIQDNDYNTAIDLANAGKYEEAIRIFKVLKGYKDSAAQMEACQTAISDRDEKKYADAIELYNAGKYVEAMAAFTALNGYKDSAARINEIRPKYYKQLLFTANVGSTVFFGSYEQDNNTSNGKEDIEWIVLAKNGKRILVISKYALDTQKYNPSLLGTVKNATWETCYLRRWLNGTFMNAAFSSSEKNSIASSTVTADKNPSYSTSPGKNTTDKVFLLSIIEANKYFSSDEARKCEPTDYAIAQGAKTSDSYKTGGRGTCYWWLRSPGYISERAAGVSINGSIYDYGFDVDGLNDYAVRPALWIDLDADN